MKASPVTKGSGRFETTLWRVLTLEQLMTTSIAHLAYWIGLGLILLVGFAVIGGAVGAALREGAILGWILAIPAFLICLLVIVALGILWRSFCELYVVLIRAGEDLNVMRRVAEARGMVPREEPPAPSAYPDLREKPSASAQNADLGSP